MHLLLMFLLTLQSQSGTASGVVRLSTGEPVVGMRVAAVSLAGPEAEAGAGALMSITQTDSAGHYRLENILPGRYYIQAGLIDAPTYYPGVTATSGAMSVLINAGSAIDGLNFTMARGSTGVRVSGRVPLAAEGTAQIVLREESGGSRFATAQVRSDRTFEFLKIPYGTYTLTAIGLPNLSIIVADKDINNVGMPAGPGVTLSGVVGLGPRSRRSTRQRVVLTGPSAWVQLDSALDVNGAFSIANVPPGTYTLKTIPGSVVPVATIVVADRDIAGITVPGYGELSGKAIFQDGGEIPDPPVAWMIEAKPDRGEPIATTIYSDGSFRFLLHEGQYRISLGKLPPGVSVKSLTYGAIDLMKDSLTLDGSADPGEIRVVLEMK